MLLALLLLSALPSSQGYAFAFPRHDDVLLNSGKQCPPGYELRYDRGVRKYECVCKKYHLCWPEDGLCYREYQQGPCPEGHR